VLCQLAPEYPRGSLVEGAAEFLDNSSRSGSENRGSGPRRRAMRKRSRRLSSPTRTRPIFPDASTTAR
jgi:hypothetical protein